MLSKATKLLTGLFGGGTGDARSEGARKAARTREAKARRRSQAAKRAAQVRRRRDQRVEAMVEATKRS